MAAVVWGPLLWWGSISRGPPFLHVCFSGANLIWVLLSLPSFVLCSVFRSLSGFAFLGSWCCRSGVSAGVFVGVSLSVLRSFLCVVGSRCCLAFVLFFGCCWLPSLPDVVSLPPAVGPVWRPGPVCTLVPPSGYLVASVTAWLPCFTAGSVVVLCRPYFIFVSWQQRLLALCGVFYHPLHHVACAVRMLQFYHAEVFIRMMIQVPHWSPLSCTIAILMR